MGSDSTGIAFTHEHHRARIVFRPGSIAALVDEARALDASRLQLIATSSARNLADSVALAAGSVVHRIDGVRQHVPEEDVDRALSAAEEADAIVAIGGGSAIGLAKALAVRTGKIVVAVPTTYSGSEVTPIYGVTGPDGKKTARSPGALPRLVIYDPEVTVPLPSSVTAASGMNAVAHGVEALYAPDASPLTRLLAEEAIRVLARALPSCVDRPDDLGARSAALYGAWLAGSALADAQMGLHHTLVHVIGGDHRLSHGDLNAVLLPHVTAFNAGHATAALQRVAAALATDDAVEGVRSLASRLGAPASLRSIGFEREWLAPVAERTVAALGANPRPVEARDVEDLLRDAY